MRELLAEAHRVEMRSVGEVLMGLEGVEPAMRRRLLNGLRKRLGFKTSGQKSLEEAQACARSGWSPWQLCPICGCQPVDEMTGAPQPVAVRRWHCAAHAGQAAPGDMEPMGSGIRMSPSGAFVEYNPGEIEKERAEAELRERRYQEQLAVRKLEADARRRQKEAEDEMFRRELPPGLAG